MAKDDAGISEFIKAVMPDATVDEWREAERNLERFLETVDESRCVCVVSARRPARYLTTQTRVLK